MVKGSASKDSHGDCPWKLAILDCLASLTSACGVDVNPKVDRITCIVLACPITVLR